MKRISQVNVDVVTGNKKNSPKSKIEFEKLKKCQRNKEIVEYEVVTIIA